MNPLNSASSGYAESMPNLCCAPSVKAREDRPDACTALHLEWFKTAHDRSSRKDLPAKRTKVEVYAKSGKLRPGSPTQRGRSLVVVIEAAKSIVAQTHRRIWTLKIRLRVQVIPLEGVSLLISASGA